MGYRHFSVPCFGAHRYVPVLRPFLIALQFLTRVPVRLARAPEPLDLGRSLLWYPVVGLLLGGLLFGLDASLSATVPPLRAVGSSRVDLQACKLEYSIVSPK